MIPIEESPFRPFFDFYRESSRTSWFPTEGVFQPSLDFLPRRLLLSQTPRTASWAKFSRPFGTASQLALALLVLRVLADHTHHTAAIDDLALVTNFLY